MSSCLRPAPWPRYSTATGTGWPGSQAEAPKKVPETDAIFANINAKDSCGEDQSVMRVSMDCKATVNIGEYSCGGKTRADNRAAEHDMGCQEKYTP